VPVRVDHLAARRPDGLQRVDRQALVVGELSRVAGLGRRRSLAGLAGERGRHRRGELVPGGRRRTREQIGAVEEQTRVGVEGQRPQSVGVPAGLQRAAQKAVGVDGRAAQRRVVQRENVAVVREFGRPGDVQIENVHIGVTRLGAGHHLAALRVGDARQLLDAGVVVRMQRVPLVDQRLPLATEAVVAPAEDHQLPRLDRAGRGEGGQHVHEDRIGQDDAGDRP
jgi:hypothetical protein